MKTRTLLKAITLTMGLVVGFVPTAVSAKTLNAAVGLGPKNSTVISYQKFADYVAENSDLDIKVFSMSLLNLKETPPGIRDGLADLGFVLPVYFPAEYSESNLAANLSMLSTSGTQVDAPGAAMAGAMTEYILNCPDCLAEYKAQKQVYLGSVASASYMMLCNKPIQSLDDFKGSKLRSGAANFTRWAESLGAISVSIPSNDMYEALSQGVVDCVMAAVSELTNNSLFDVTKYVVRRVPGGVFAGAATSNFNVDVWRELTDEQRAVILKGAARMQAEMTLAYYSLSQDDMKAAPDKGIEVVDPSANVVAASDAFIQSDLKIIEQQFTTDYGVENASTKIAEVSRLVDKWKGLTAAYADDPDGLGEVYWNEIFSKIDPKTFGME